MIVGGEEGVLYISILYFIQTKKRLFLWRSLKHFQLNSKWFLYCIPHWPNNIYHSHKHNLSCTFDKYIWFRKKTIIESDSEKMINQFWLSLHSSEIRDVWWNKLSRETLQNLPDFIYYTKTQKVQARNEKWKKQLWVFIYIYRIWQILKRFSRQLISPRILNFWRVSGNVSLIFPKTES